MKRVLMIVLCLYAWRVAKSQSVEIGLRDNQYVHACYIDRKKWLIGYEQSLLNVKVKEQNGRIYAGYILKKGSYHAAGIAYVGTEYARRWQVSGVILNGEIFKKRIGMGGTLNANYDTYFDFQFNYDIHVQYAFWQKSKENREKQQLDFGLSFGNLPEYRNNIKNLRIGMKFASGNLWVLPEVCIPNLEKGSFDYLRMLCNFGWILNFK